MVKKERFPCLICGARAIEAHIIPKAFARFVRQSSKHNVRVTHTERRKAQLGVYDPQILCAEHDGQLGVLDDYAVRLCKEFDSRAKFPEPRVYECPDVDCHKISRFVLAVVWRASVSGRPDFDTIKLGPLDAAVRQIIFEGTNLSQFTPFKLIMMRYRSEHVRTELMFSLPVKTKCYGLNSYNFALGGFRIAAVFDKRSLPRMFDPFIINRNTTMRGIVGEFESTTEFEWLAGSIRNHVRSGGMLNVD